MNNLPKLTYSPFPLGTYVRSFGNEFYLYVEKAVSLVNSEYFVLIADDTKSHFTLHWVGGVEDYIKTNERFWDIYSQIIDTVGIEYKN